MASAGIRELRQRASELLRRVQAGETIEITDRGRPVALLAPIPELGPLDVLRSRGQVTAASGDLEDLAEPLDIGDGPTASEVLARLRDDER